MTKRKLPPRPTLVFSEPACGSCGSSWWRPTVIGGVGYLLCAGTDPTGGLHCERLRRQEGDRVDPEDVRATALTRANLEGEPAVAEIEQPNENATAYARYREWSIEQAEILARHRGSEAQRNWATNAARQLLAAAEAGRGISYGPGRVPLPLEAYVAAVRSRSH